MHPIPIYKGDSTDAFNFREIRIRLETEVSLEGATARFELMSYRKSFTPEEVAGKVFVIRIPAQQTRMFPLGLVYGRLCLYDGCLRVMTASCRIPFDVKVPGRVTDGFWKVHTPVAEVTVEMGVDYAQAYNKPSINGVEVSGDRGGREYGLNRILDYSAESVYEVGDQVVYGDGIFKCVTDIETPEAWNPAHWGRIGGAPGDDVVHYSEDAGKSKVQKAQARTNIGAQEKLVSGGNIKTINSVSLLGPGNIVINTVPADYGTVKANAEKGATHADTLRGNPHNVTKSDVGLGNVDDTSDVDKPVSTAVGIELGKKADKTAVVPVAPSTDESDSALAGAKATAEFVNSSINAMAAFYITKNADGDPFATYAELASATVFYNAGSERVPTKNDYCIVVQDEEHTSALDVKPTTRYIFQGVWGGGGGWEFQYVINNTALTQAQIEAINSGVTAAKLKSLDDAVADNAEAITAETSRATAAEAGLSASLGGKRGVRDMSVYGDVSSWRMNRTSEETGASEFTLAKVENVDGYYYEAETFKSHLFWKDGSLKYEESWFRNGAWEGWREFDLDSPDVPDAVGQRFEASLNVVFFDSVSVEGVNAGEEVVTDLTLATSGDLDGKRSLTDLDVYDTVSDWMVRRWEGEQDPLVKPTYFLHRSRTEGIEGYLYSDDSLQMNMYWDGSLVYRERKYSNGAWGSWEEFSIDQSAVTDTIGSVFTGRDSLFRPSVYVSGVNIGTLGKTGDIATRDFVNSSINAMAAFYLTADATGNPFATKAALDAAFQSGTFYNGGERRSPTKNDYLIVLSDESRDSEGAPVTGATTGPTTRYSYDGAQFAFQYVVNRTPLSNSQIAALNSGVTASKVSGYDAHVSNSGIHITAAERTAWNAKVSPTAFSGRTFDLSTIKNADGALKAVLELLGATVTGYSTIDIDVDTDAVQDLMDQTGMTDADGFGDMAQSLGVTVPDTSTVEQFIGMIS